MTTHELLDDFGAEHIAIATDAKWTTEGIGRQGPLGIDTATGATVLTPDDIMAGVAPEGPVMLFDDDHFYIGRAIAEKLRRDGCEVTLVTSAGEVSSWAHNTLDQHAIQKLLMDLGVRVITAHNLGAVHADAVNLSGVYADANQLLDFATAVLVTMRRPVADLWLAPPDLIRIDDALSPSTIAGAVYSGHRLARELGETEPGNSPFRRELIHLSSF